MKKNIILIFTDNQQASTLGCYGNKEIYTPNLDQLSAESVTFDNAYCPNAFCSPCRASLLTGLLPSQHGVHSWIDTRKKEDWPHGWHALDGLRTLPMSLSENGYKTALIGKYHLGETETPMPGFDHWVTMEDGHVRSFYRNQVTENGENYLHEGHTVDFFTDKAVNFIDEKVESDQAFFLYLPYPAPYGHWPATKETDTCRHTKRYEDCPMDSIPREGLSKGAIANYEMVKEFSGGGMDYSMLLSAPNDLATMRNYYSQISMVDDGVGRIVEKIKSLGIYDDTLLIFTSDHGLSIGHHGFWGHGAATFPSNLHHAAHSVPLILRNGNESQLGKRSKNMVSNMDIYATILDVAGLLEKNYEKTIPSRSLVELLTENNTSRVEDAVFSEQEETRVVRTQKWAYFKRFSDSETFSFIDELFDVENDPKETRNLISDSNYVEIVEKLDIMLEDYFSNYSKSEADLWQGGRPKQNSTRKHLWKDVWGPDWDVVYSYQKSNDE